LTPRRIALLGATGSIGRSTLEVVRAHPDRFRLVLAAARSNEGDLLGMARELGVRDIVLTHPARKLTDLPPGTRVHYGEDALQSLLRDLDYDIALNAVSGSAGLASTMSILERGNDLALANKESLVMAGHLVETLRATSSSRIIPVDSEHSALFQALGQSPRKHVRNLWLTASGGPFRDLPLDRFHSIRPEHALKHPTWDMGVKVTIDSATMMNKGLEEIEAHWLFDTPYEAIRTVIHPQSIIHSMVEMADGSILAQMSVPSMQLPILYALGYPDRVESNLVSTNLLQLPALTFREVEPDRYPLFMLARDVARAGGILPTVMNAANEAAIERFLRDEISFTGIHELVEEAVASWPQIPNPTLDEILACNREVFHRCRNGESLRVARA
jgi:1-deoxy-D-xylulose-5-phosphate reductoisomerase